MLRAGALLDFSSIDTEDSTGLGPAARREKLEGQLWPEKLLGILQQGDAGSQDREHPQQQEGVFRPTTVAASGTGVRDQREPGRAGREQRVRAHRPLLLGG